MRLFHHFAGIIHDAPAPRILRRGRNGDDVHRHLSMLLERCDPLAWSGVVWGVRNNSRQRRPPAAKLYTMCGSNVGRFRPHEPRAWGLCEGEPGWFEGNGLSGVMDLGGLVSFEGAALGNSG